MRELELSGRGKAVYGALCAVCCVVPMLVVLGVVSVGIAFVAGLSMASAGAVALLAYLVIGRRVGPVALLLRRSLGGVGAGLSAVALGLMANSPSVAASVLSVSLALLAASALLALASADLDATPA